MDKVREFLRTFRRVHFWVITALISLLSITFWFLAVGALEKEKDKRVSEIEGLYNEISRIVNEPKVPNDQVSEEMDKLIAARQEEIREAWQLKYDQQNSEETGILTWPSELNTRFTRKVTPLRPIEKALPFPLPENDDRRLNIGDREDYRDYINAELPRLAESIGAEWMAQAGGPGPGPRRESMRPGLPGQTGETLATQSVVEWDSSNQSELIAEHFTFGQMASGGGGSRQGGLGRPPRESMSVGPGDGDNVPDTLEVLYAQEDLWVLRSLMKIIERTNGGAKSRHNAAIKKIEFIRIGRNAKSDAGSVTVVKTAEEEQADSGAGPGMDGGFREEPMGGGIERDYGEGLGEPGEMSGPDPAEGRYVDKDYQPLPAATLRKVMGSTDSIAPEEAYLAVAKRIPVRMRISIDQKRLPKFLVECANAELTVEVRQLRVNPTDDGSLMTSGIGGEMGRLPRMSPRETMRPGMGGDQPEINIFPFDVTAEIYGIIYLYNPVDDRALGIEAGSGEELDPNSVTLLVLPERHGRS